MKRFGTQEGMVMADSDGNTKVAFWLLGGVVSVVVAGTLAYTQHRAVEPVHAPAAVSGEADGGVILRKTLVEQVFFATGQTAVPPDGAVAIQAAMTALGKASADSSLVLSGFHDATGSAATNAEVAKQRAFAVRDALLAGGVPAGRIRLEKPQLTLDAGDPKLARRVDISISE